MDEVGKPGCGPLRPRVDQTRQLYVERRPRPASPRHRAGHPDRTDTGYTASDDTLSRWHDPGDIEFVYTAGEAMWNLQRYGLGQWTEPRCPIASVSGTTITMAQPCWDNSTRRVEFPDIPGRTVNMVGPGDLTNGRLPAYAGERLRAARPAGRVVPGPRPPHRLLQAARGRGPAPRGRRDARPGEAGGRGNGPVHDVAFRGLQFSYATWLTPRARRASPRSRPATRSPAPTGYATQGLCEFVARRHLPVRLLDQGAGQRVSGRPANRVRRRRVRPPGRGRAGVGHGTKDSTVRGSVFTDISGNGVEVGGVDQPAGRRRRTYPRLQVDGQPPLRAAARVPRRRRRSSTATASTT